MQKTDRSEIVKLSADLFRAKGFRATTMADIARATGLLKGSVYHHFPSKDAILIEVLDTSLNTFEASVFSLAYKGGRPKSG
ncbi:hypothetical protein CAI21_15155 [Alkalilimnicola ehrlichii]|uniref:HTH tetR-type domain-containing protein n=1 Tax=Alkalilimnicola ehrlichii TaxID=351052 RepID=A0A3E0WSJ3_9GAMM|nr:helix-turn-helix domain-containing protein [Alkalilimnicola ehrlichii]RFA27186.1 hypothetical protein CAI21_15155 [Alkalilimnicola ehrlichii]RFA35359.1 hypothetical protein CAL65_12810 [Alkalilimnicola ehrlichii]